MSTALRGLLPGLVLLLPLVACEDELPAQERCPVPDAVVDVEQPGADKPDEPDDDDPEELQATFVHFELSLEDVAEGAAALVFDQAWGLDLSVDHDPTHPSLSFSTATFSGASTTKGSELSKWFSEVRALHDSCDEKPEACVRLWQGSDLPRSGVLTAHSDDGEVLATWHLDEVWPSAVVLSDTDDFVLHLELVAQVPEFSFHTGPAAPEAIFGGRPPAASAPTQASKAEGAPEELYRFSSAYHSIAGALHRLNTLHDAHARAIREQGPAKFEYSPAANFKIEIDGVIQGGFKEVTGLESEVEIIEYRDGDNLIVGKRPGRPKFKNIVLKRQGTVGDHSLLEWYKRVLRGSVDRRAPSIIYLGPEGAELMRTTLTEAWPVKWIPAQGHSDTHAVEELEFVVEKVERA